MEEAAKKEDGLCARDCPGVSPRAAAGIGIDEMEEAGEPESDFDAAPGILRENCLAVDGLGDGGTAEAAEADARCGVPGCWRPRENAGATGRGLYCRPRERRISTTFLAISGCGSCAMLRNVLTISALLDRTASVLP